MKLFFSILALLILSSCQKDDRNQISFDMQNDFNVIDGTNVTSRETKASKSVVVIEMTDANHKTITYCSAVLIGPQTVLTAAHCFNPDLITGVAAFNVIFENRMDHIQNPKKRTGFSYIQHPQYNKNPKRWIYRENKWVDPELIPNFEPKKDDYESFVEQGDHDLAVLVFEGKIPTGFDFVQIDTDTTADYSGKLIYVYGYGRSEDYLDNNGKFDTTTGYLRRGTIIVDSDFNLFEDRYFTSKMSKNQLCQGDSGGPQFFNEKNVLKVIGINSAVASDDDAVVVPGGENDGHPYLSCRGRSQVAKVAPYATWIKSEEKRMLAELAKVKK